MKLPIEKAVILGAGTMGARIAAHFANTGLPCMLLDIVPPELKPGAPASERNRLARNALEAAKKSRLEILRTIWRAAQRPTGSLKWWQRIWKSSADCFRVWRNFESPVRSSR